MIVLGKHRLRWRSFDELPPGIRFITREMDRIYRKRSDSSYVDRHSLVYFNIAGGAAYAAVEPVETVVPAEEGLIQCF